MSESSTFPISADDSGQADRILYDYFSFVMLEPIPLEGSGYLEVLASMTAGLADECLNADLAMPIERMSDWISVALGAEDPGAAQRMLAADRTYLFRGVDDKGPLPPYEGFYSPEGESTIAAIGKAYRNANVHPANSERLDYLGQELAFASVLLQKEADAWLHRDEMPVQGPHAVSEEFKENHLYPWVGRYCDAAIPFAKTDYFKGFLNGLNRWLGSAPSK